MPEVGQRLVCTAGPTRDDVLPEACPDGVTGAACTLLVIRCVTVSGVMVGGGAQAPKKKIRLGLPATQWITVYNAHRPMKQRYHYNVANTRGAGAHPTVRASPCWMGPQQRLLLRGLGVS